MGSSKLEGMRVAALVADGFEEIELTVPKKALEKRGATVEIVSLRPGSIRGMNGTKEAKKIDVDTTVFTAHSSDYHALLIPGGFINPDLLRQSDKALEFVRRFEENGKPIAVICHGPWVLASAGLVEGRKLTSWPGIQDDIRNAGGFWMDSSVVRDHNWVSSQGPDDILAFTRATVKLFSRHVPEVAEEEEEKKTGTSLATKVAIGAIAIGAARYFMKRKSK